MPSPMKSPEPLVPTIDIASFLADPESSPAHQVIDSVRQACKKTGFFQIVGHGLPENLQHQLFQASQRFFALRSEEKTKLDSSTTIGARGYGSFGSESNPADTSFGEQFWVGHDIPIDDPKVQARRFFMGSNIWPTTLSDRDFKDHVEAYFAAIHALTLKVFDLIWCTMPNSQSRELFDEFTADDAVSVLRMIHYRPQSPTVSPEGKKQEGAAAHTDFGAITLLLQDDHSGLEVLDPNTKEFVAVEPLPNALVINIGDMLSFWTGGEYKSSVHRVINKAPVDRYSAALFFDGSLDCPLVPLARKDAVAEGEDILTVEKHLINCFLGYKKDF